MHLALGKLFSSACVKSEDNVKLINLKDEIVTRLKPMATTVTICDLPMCNENGLTQYNYDEHHQSIRQRRVNIAKKFNLTLSDAPFNQHFVFELAEEVKKTHNMPGQCAEMASIAAIEVVSIASTYEYFVYTVQLPNCNHTIALLSNNNYKCMDPVDWSREFKSNAIVVDLWQGALSINDTEALVSLAKRNNYTKLRPKAHIQCKVTGNASFYTDNIGN